MRRVPIFQRRIGAALKQKIDHRWIVALGGNVQRRFSSLGSCRNKNGLRAEQLAHRLNIARANRIKQRLARIIRCR